MGYEPLVTPLLAIRPIPQAAPSLEGVVALAFTSSNGVRAFTSLTTRRDLPVFAVGEITAETARLAGFPNVLSADGALADLARLLDQQALPGVVLAPGAKEPSGDLAARVRRSSVRALPIYEAVETGASAPPSVDAVLLQSPRAAHALAVLWSALEAAPLVVAQSPAIAEAMGSLTTPRIASRPTETALLEALGNPPPAV